MFVFPFFTECICNLIRVFFVFVFVFVTLREYSYLFSNLDYVPFLPKPKIQERTKSYKWKTSHLISKSRKGVFLTY